MDTNKTRRLANACDFCRKKKVRCDSAQMPRNICSNCLKDSIDCTHTAYKKKRGPRVRIMPRLNLSSVDSIINAVIAEPETYPIPEDSNVVRKILLDIAYYTRSLEKQLSQWKKVATQHELSTITINSDDEEDSDSDSDFAGQDTLLSIRDDLTGTLKGLKLGPNEPARSGFMPKSSSLVMMRTAALIKEELLGEQVRIHPGFGRWRRDFWVTYPWQQEPEPPQPPLIFPEDDLLHNLCDLYFTIVQPYIPLLHQSQFRKSVSDGLHLQDRKFGMVVLGVCAVASKYSQDPRNLLDGISNEHSLGWRWYQQTIYTRPASVDSPSIYDLQSCSLSAMFVFMSSIIDSRWAIAGVGIRLAQEMGVHTKKKRGLKGQAAPRTVESELCTRAFWVLLNFDVILSMTFGRPRATTSEDFDIDYPLECDEMYLQSEDPEKAFVQPPGVPSEVSFFTSYCKLMEIVGITQRALYSVKKSKFWKKMGGVTSNWEQKAVTELDSALNQWFSSIPEHLKWDPNAKDGLFFRQSSVLHTAFYWAQMQVHGLFIHGRSGGNNSLLQQPSFPSLAICTTAARCSVRIIDIQRRLRMQLPAIFLTPVFSTSIFLYLQAARRKLTTNANKDMQGVYCCLEFMSSLEKRFSASGRLCDILRSIICLGDQHFQGSKSGLETLNSIPEQLEHSGSSVIPISADGLDFSLMTPGAEMNVHNSDSGSSPFSFDSSLFYGQSSVASNSSPNSTLHSDWQLADFPNFTDSQWPMEVEPSSGLVAEDWVSFMTDVDEILNLHTGQAML